MTIRRIFGGAASVIPLAGLLLAGLLIAPSIGPRMASHWSGVGAPDGFTDTWPAFWVVTVITATLTTVAIIFVVRHSAGSTARVGGAIAAFTAAILGASWVMLALTTAHTPYDAPATIGANWLLLLAAPIVGAAVALLVPSSPRPDADGHPVAPLPIPANERVAWTGSTGSTLFLIVGLAITGVALTALIVMLATGIVDATLIAPIVGVLAGLSTLLLARVRLSVDRRGVRLVSDLFGIPLIRVPLRSIASVSVETIDPARWGGWGYRISGAGRAYVTRRSTGIVVTNRDGFASAVTIEDAAAAASVAQTLLERR